MKEAGEVKEAQQRPLKAALRQRQRPGQRQGKAERRRKLGECRGEQRSGERR